MKEKDKQFPVLGILGGGQLGRMLIQAAQNYCLEVHVLDPDLNAPCSDLASTFVCGDFRDEASVLSFGRNVDILTIEIEHVHVGALYQLVKEGKEVYPQPEIIELVQDKGKQKSFYKAHGFPTSEFTLAENAEEVKRALIDFLPAVQKLRTSGYDGKGVVVLKDVHDFEQIFDAPSVLERRVSIQREFSILVAGDGKGATSVFPAVDMWFNEQANLVELLVSPSDLPAQIIENAKSIAIDLANKLGIRGILAVEFFLDTENAIFINEIAPRPHNSGHQTIEGNFTSQFEQHLRAVLGWPFGKTDSIYNSAMVNLLGAEGFLGEAVYRGLNGALSRGGVYIHLYGKSVTKPYRKMGHVTIVHQERNELLKIANEVLSEIRIESLS